MEPNLQRRPGIGQVLLGVFIVWQLIFLAGANLVAFFPHGEPEEVELSDSRSMPADASEHGVAQHAIEVVGAVTDRWAHLTGQMQAWWLFAPSFPAQATFPVVELRWDSAARPPVRLASSLEPEDPHAYCRLPGSLDRLFHYEIRLGLVYLGWDENLKGFFPWRTIVQERLQRQWRSIRAYVRWRMQQYCELHPDLPPPNEAVLLVHIYRTPRPGQDPQNRPVPVEKPLARWRPGKEPVENDLPMEMWDPQDEVFVRLASKR